MRGLKLPISGLEKMKSWSHLLQMRGLKLLLYLTLIAVIGVASFTDAWIETTQ